MDELPNQQTSLVLLCMQRATFEQLQSVKLGTLSLKMVFLTMLTSIERVGDLQAISVSETYQEFNPACSHVILSHASYFNILKYKSTKIGEHKKLFWYRPPNFWTV